MSFLEQAGDVSALADILNVEEEDDVRVHHRAARHRA